MDSPAVSQRNVLVDVAGRAQEVADLIEGPAEAMSRIEVLEAAHRPIASFYSPVILFDHVVFVLAGAVVDVVAKFLGNGLGIAGMAVGGDLLGLDLCDRLGGGENPLGGGFSAVFAELSVDWVPAPSSSPKEIPPPAGFFDVGPSAGPAPAGFPGPPLAQA